MKERESPLVGRGSPGVERRGGAPLGNFLWPLAGSKQKNAAKPLAGPRGASVFRWTGQ